MPFVPVNMPGTGVSTLKAALTREGLSCDVYYGALEFLRLFGNEVPIRDLRLDYDFIATNMHIGELYFARALWDDPAADEWLQIAIDRLETTPNQLFSARHMQRMAIRLRRYAARIPEFLDCCYVGRAWTDYDIIGFSSTFSQNVASLTLAKRIHANHPDVCVVFGGANCEAVMGEQLLRSFPQIDFVIRGEADFAFPRFVANWRESAPIATVPGIVYRDGGRVVTGAPPEPVADMDSVPIPYYDDFFEQLPAGDAPGSLRANVVLPIETSRGCWWGAVRHCIFCGLNPTTMKFRSKSAARALREFQTLKERYGETHFYAVDNIIDKRYFRDLLPMLESEQLDIFYETKANLREAEVAQLARAGVRQIQPGIEGLDSRILALMKKGVKGYQNVELLKWCAIYGIDVTWFYLYGFPNEPEQAYLDDAALMWQLHHLPPPRNANPVLLDRFSPIYSDREQYGVRNVRVPRAAQVYYCGLSEAEAFNLSYHFDMELPQGDALSYAHSLCAAILRWKYEYLRGARLYQFACPNTTLLIDTRVLPARSFLLEGRAARLYQSLRNAQPLRAVFEHLASHQNDLQSAAGDDAVLSKAAHHLGSVILTEPGEGEEAAALLADLISLGLVLAIDDRFIALAVDCTRESEAHPLGLAPFVARTDRRTAGSAEDLREVEGALAEY